MAAPRYGHNGTVGPAPRFSWDEVRCRDGWLPDDIQSRRNIVKSCMYLNEFRRSIARRFKVSERNVFIIINSCARSVSYNRKIGGATQSFHSVRFDGKGTSAMDIQILVKRLDGKLVKLKPSFVGDLAEKYVAEYRNGGIGRYAVFTHVDHRGYRSRWVG